MSSETVRKKVESLFNRKIQITSKRGDLKGVFSIDISPWEFKQNDGSVNSGFTARLGMAKLPSGDSKGSNAFINIDPSNQDIRSAISEMYKEFDKVVNKK